MNIEITKLSQEHLPLVDAFTCVENNEQLAGHNSKTRRRIINHSKEMDDFLKDEAYEEQDKNLNVTYLFVDEDNNQIAGYVSLCSDCIKLESEEKDQLELSYTTIPAIKIARLAVNNQYKGKGLGKTLIKFSAYIANKVQSICGLVFLTLDCYEHRLSFYEKNGFVKNSIQPIQLPYDSPISMRILLSDYLDTIENDI